MESVGSNSPPPEQWSSPHFGPTQPIADRILRALHHRLHLLHRSNSTFFILGATGNVYTVTLSASPSCTCPDRTTPCKHILFVFLRVLGVSLNDTCLHSRTLRPCHLIRLLTLPMSPATLAGPHVRNKFHQLFSNECDQSAGKRPQVELEDGTTCPVCMEEMRKEERVVACGACGNYLHEECFKTWKRSRGRRIANCVICRARWRARTEQERRYMNLSAYISEDDDVTQGSGASCTA